MLKTKEFLIGGNTEMLKRKEFLKEGRDIDGEPYTLLKGWRRQYLGQMILIESHQSESHQLKHSNMCTCWHVGPPALFTFFPCICQQEERI